MERTLWLESRGLRLQLGLKARLLRLEAAWL